MKTLTEQHKELKKHFPKIAPLPKELPRGDLYLFPHWSTVAKSYPNAVQKVLDVLKSTRPFYNWSEGMIDATHLRESSLKNMPQYKLVMLSCDFGIRHKGKSVQTVRTEREEGEVLLGAYEVGIALLTHPELLQKYEDMWLDCSGDEFAPSDGREFSCAPVFRFHDGKVRFRADRVDGAYDDYGSASAFLPQLETGNLDSFESLSLESRIRALEEWRERVQQP